MRFMVMHKVDANMEAGSPPSQQIIQNMGALVQGSIKSGVMENGAGLHRSAKRVRVSFSGGERQVQNGPYPGDNELVAACYMIRATSIEHAVELSARFAKVIGDVEIEIGPVVEPWDLGFMPKPQDLKDGRYLLLQKGNVDSETKPRDARVQAALSELLQQLRAAGVLELTETLLPTARGARLPSSNGGSKRTWVDGPFAESKELIAGFSILNLPTKQEAIDWATRYAEILGNNQVDVRELG